MPRARRVTASGGFRRPRDSRDLELSTPPRAASGNPAFAWRAAADAHAALLAGLNELPRHAPSTRDGAGPERAVGDNTR
jgi:hypothetical protein